MGDHEFVVALFHIVVAFVFSSAWQPDTRLKNTLLVRVLLIRYRRRIKGEDMDGYGKRVFYCYSIIAVPNFPLCPPLLSSPPTPHAIVHIHESSTHVFWTSPFLFFSPFPPLSPLAAVSQLSVCLMFLYLWFCFTC